MKKLKCIIVDDEITAIESLMVWVKAIPQLELIGTFTNPMEALAFLRKNEVYLVFLDIHMRPLTGLEFAKIVEEKKVIFTTAYDEFALKSYELPNVVDYLSKPIFFERFSKAIQKASKHYVADSFAPQAYIEGYLTFKNQGATIKIDHGSIIMIQAYGNYSNVFYEGKRIIAPLPIGDIEKILPDTKFIRVNKSIIANKDKIMNNKSGYIELLGGQKIKIGKAFRDNPDAWQ